MITRRSVPRRVAVLCVLVVGAVLYAVKSGDDGWLDVIRFLAGAVGGCFVGIGAIIVTAAGGFGASASIWLSGAFAGMLATVGLLYPLPQFRR